jgi:hypothetical protein
MSTWNTAPEVVVPCTDMQKMESLVPKKVSSVQSVNNTALPVKPSGKEAATRCCRQQRLWFSQFGTTHTVLTISLFFGVRGLKCVLILIPLIRELSIHNRCSIKVPNACNKAGCDCLRESFQRLLVVCGIIPGIWKNRLEALTIGSYKCWNTLVKC